MTAHTTKLFKHLAISPTRCRGRILQVILQFCSLFELQHRGFSKPNVAAEIGRIENGLNVLQAMAGEGCDLRHGRASDANRTTAVPLRS